MNEPINLNTVIKPAKDQVFADVEGETVLLNVNSGIYFGLNALGTRIWELIQEPRSVALIRDQILEEYDVELERCQQDVINLLDKLLDAGLVVLVDHGVS